MKNKQTISKIKQLSSIIKNLTENLSDDKELNTSDILNMSDMLDEVEITSKKIQNKSNNIFLKAGAQNICLDIKKIYGRIEEIENKRLADDEEILTKLYEVSFKLDYLDLNFHNIIPQDIEVMLEALNEEFQYILLQKPYNEKIINPIFEKIKNKLIDLNFRSDFPIVEELDENKNSYAHRLILIADDLKEKNPKKALNLTNQIDELMDLVWLSKMFIYGNFEKAQYLFDKINPILKEKIAQIIWRVKGENLNALSNDKKWLVPAALMNYVADVINA